MVRALAVVLIVVCASAAAVAVSLPQAAAAADAPSASADARTPEQKLLDLVGFLRRDGKFAEARDLAERGLAIAEKNHGPESRQAARWLTQLGLTLQAQGRHREAEPHLRRAFAIHEKADGPDAPQTGEALADLGALLMDQGRLTDAEPLTKRALAIAEKTRGPDHPGTAQSLTALGILYIAQGRLAEAEPLLKRALAIDEKTHGPNHPDTAASLNNMAELYRLQGRFAEAEPLYKRAVAIDEKNEGPIHPSVASDLSNLALLYQNQERYAEAETLYRCAIDIREKTLGDHPDTATSLANFATMLVEMGRLGEAEPLIKRALTITEKTLGPAHPDTAQSLNSLAGLYRTQGRAAEARPLYERALAIFEKALGPDHPSTAMALNNLGEIYRADNRFAEAEAMFKRALSINEKILPPDHADLTATRANLAGLYLFTRRYGEAEALFKAALAVLERTLPADHVQIAMANYWLSRTLLEQDKVEEAFARGRRAVEIAARISSRAVARELGGGWREEFTYDHIFTLQARNAFALSRRKPQDEASLREAGFEVAQRTGGDDTGRAVANMAARFSAGSGELAARLREQQELLRRLNGLDRRLAAALGASDPTARAQAEPLRREREALGARLNAVDATLRRDHRAYADLADPQPLSIVETQALLGANEAVVLPLVLEEATILFAVSKTAVAWTVSPVPEARLTAGIAALRRQLDPARWQGSMMPFDRALSHRLYGELWAPLNAVLKDKAQVFVVPTGPLTSFPFAVLVAEAPQGGKAGDGDPRALRETAWLAKRHALIALPSISSLKALRLYANKGSGTEPFAGFGDPALGGAMSSQPLIAGARSVASIYRGANPDPVALRELTPLPGTAGELKALAKALDASETADVYLRERATEARIKTLDLSRKRVVAFATHGLMAGDMGLGEPGLVFTPPGVASERDDGYLAASEAARLDLRADWIILSACNTAAGDAPGAKGLSGLARAFFLAGARSLLVSHWPVWDDAAGRITTASVKDFQANPAQGRAEALRQAMLALMNDASNPRYAHPAAWAPFVLVGEPRGN